MASSLHVVLFPFMAKGHMIPIFQLARLFHRRNATVTLFTTPANHPYVTTSLSDTPTTIISLPFPENIPGVPSGVESVDKLPSLSLFFPFTSSTKLMQPDFEKSVQSLKPPVTFMVTDGLLSWTLESANKLGIPRLVYYGMSNFVITIGRVIAQNTHIFHRKSGTDLVPVPEFSWMTVNAIEFDDALIGRDVSSPFAKWMAEMVLATLKSYGMITNSFIELEPMYTHYWNSKFKPKSWSVGPFCLVEKVHEIESASNQRSSWMVWLDKKLEVGSPVLYVAFRSQAEISLEQIKEIKLKLGLERSEVNFLWVMRRAKNGSGSGFEAEFDDGFEERVREKGIVV